jgi:hypothetical protein
MRFNYVRSLVSRSSSKFLPNSKWDFGSLLFIADKFGDLSLQETESWEITGSGTDHVPPISAQVGLVSEARLGHGFSASGEAESDPSGDKADHHEIGCPTAVDPINQPPPEFDSDSGREVYMVGQGEPATNQTTLQIAREADDEIARATRLAQEANEAAEKRHRGQQDNSGSSDGEAGDGAVSRGHHSKFN